MMNSKLLKFIPVSILMLSSITCFSQTTNGKKQLDKVLRENFRSAAQQYKYLGQQVPADKFPKTWHPENKHYEWSNSDWWCSGFYPGTLLNIYRRQKDTALYNEALRKMKLLAKEQYNTTTHDLGFMMYCSYGIANEMSPSDAYRQVLLQSAKSLASRFDPKVGCIKSWDSKSGDYLVIIDNMMNLELLFWATKASGDSSFYKIAVTHANTTMNNHFRADYSSYHVLEYDPETGAVKKKRTAQGYSDESAWARGQAWGLYGYTMAYRFTGNKRYLEQAQHIASFILNNPNLPENKIPYWDYNAPGIPNALRDVSAAAVTASALLELQRYTDKKNGSIYLAVATKILTSLSGTEYLAEYGKNGGFLLMHSVGHIPQKTEIDVPLTYADYYFTEAMNRYLELPGNN